MYVPSEEHVIQWLSFVALLIIYLSLIILYIKYAVGYAEWVLLIVEGRTVTYSC